MFTKILNLKYIYIIVGITLILSIGLFGYQLNTYLQNNNPAQNLIKAKTANDKPLILNTISFKENLPETFTRSGCDKYPVKYPSETGELNIENRLSEYFNLSIINKEPNYLLMNYAIPNINYFYVMYAIAGNAPNYVEGNGKKNLQNIDDSLSSARETYGLTLKNAEKITKTEYYQSTICRLQLDVKEYNQTKSDRTKYVIRYQDYLKEKTDSMIEGLIHDEIKLDEKEYIDKVVDFFVSIKVARGQLESASLSDLKNQVMSQYESFYEEIKFMVKNDLKSFYDSPDLKTKLKNNLIEKQRCLVSKIPSLEYKEKLLKELEKMEQEGKTTDEYYKKIQWYIGLDQGNPAGTGTEAFCNNKFDNTEKIIFLETLKNSNLIAKKEYLESIDTDIKDLLEK